MQIKKIAAACAVAFASTSVFAANLTDHTDTPDYVIYLSGATAPDNFLDGIATAMFQGTKGGATNPWYKFVDDIDGKQQRAYFGQMKGTAPVPDSLQNKKVLFIKRSTGGSVIGVNPVARAQSIAVLQAANAACTAISGAGNYKCPVVGDDSGTHADARVPDFGVSDVAPALFKGTLNVEYGASELTTEEANGLAIKPVNLLAMGLAVTNTVPATTYISKAAYGALLSGNQTTWTGIGAAAPTASDSVIVCRRVPGSGTQTSYNWYFNNFPCAKESVAGSGDTAPTRMKNSVGYNDLDEDEIPDTGSGTSADPYVITPSGYTVIENSTSGNVRDCLNKAADGGTHTFKDEQGRYFSVNFGSGGYGAIGVLSVDSLDDTSSDGTTGSRTPVSSTAGFSFRAMDGAAAYWDSLAGAGVTAATTGTTGTLPTKANLIDAKYEFAVELTMQHLSTLSSGPVYDFVDYFVKEAGKPDNNTKLWVAAVPPNYTPPTANVAKATRYGNMCAPLQLLY